MPQLIEAILYDLQNSITIQLNEVSDKKTTDIVSIWEIIRPNALAGKHVRIAIVALSGNTIIIGRFKHRYDINDQEDLKKFKKQIKKQYYNIEYWKTLDDNHSNNHYSKFIQLSGRCKRMTSQDITTSTNDNSDNWRILFKS